MSVRKGTFKREKSSPLYIARVEDVANPLTEHIQAISHVFPHLSKWHFFDTAGVKYFEDKKLSKIVLLKFEEPLDTNQLILSSQPIKLPLCKIHYLHSINILFGYVIEVPNFLIDVKKKYVSIVRQSAKREKHFKGVEMLFQNDHLNVFHSEEGASLVTFNERYESVDPDYLRIGAKTKNTDAKDN